MKGLTYEALAELAGRSTSSISRALNGTPISKAVGKNIAAALGVELSVLLQKRDRSGPDIEQSPTEQMQLLVEGVLLPATECMAGQSKVKIREGIGDGIGEGLRWLDTALRFNIVSVQESLESAEACLARIAGRRGVAEKLRRQSSGPDEPAGRAFLELLFAQFAADAAFDPAHQDLLARLADPMRRTAYTLIGLRHVQSNRQAEAQRCLREALPKEESLGVSPHDYYRALPLGLLCFASGQDLLGELHFDHVRAGPRTGASESGYPYVTLLSNFDRAFVEHIIGKRKSLTDSEDESERDQMRAFRGHIWVLLRYAKLMRDNDEARSALVRCGSRWNPPLNAQLLSSRLSSLWREFQRGTDGSPPLL